MSLKGKLNRLKTHMAIEEGQYVSPLKIETTDIPFLEEWKMLNAKPRYYEDGYSIVREVEYPLDYKHGNYQFADLLAIDEQWKASGIEHPLSSAKKGVKEMVFFDTETTGLSGGAGTYIFLLGYAKVVEDKVVVKQHFLPNPGAEVPLYYHFLTDIGDSLDLLSSFNGKAFDWPQVKTRHTFVRNEVPKLPQFAHFDLLHASRRLWKDVLPSCKLSIIEKEVLGFERENDTPGYLAPMLYFDFLSEQDPVFVEGIMKHNEWDVLSLITLYIHLSSAILRLDNKRLSFEELYQLGRWYAQLGNETLAKACFFDCLKDSRQEKSQVHFALGMIYKREKNIAMAITAFEEVTEESLLFGQAAIELAKLFEHCYKDIAKALHFAKLAFEYRDTRKESDSYVQRLRRLEMKDKQM